MADSSRALVRIETQPVSTDRSGIDNCSFELVEHETRLENRAQVERHLPDILGRALARAWIDPAFRQAFVQHPKATLARHRLHLPDSIGIAVQNESGKRPMVIVSDVTQARSRRILYLQLTLLAGR